MTVRVIILIVILLILPAPLVSRTLVVPDAIAQIQQAIDESRDSDTVLVQPGVYTESLNFGGRLIVVKSAVGPAHTIITAPDSVTLVTFDHGEDFQAVLEGFTLRGGWMAIHCINSGPTISRNVIVGQHVTDWAAVALSGPGYPLSPTVGPAAALIVNNTIMHSANGGISCFSSIPPTIRNNIVVNNPKYGLHVQGEFLSVRLSHNCFWNNGINYINVTDSGAGCFDTDPLLAEDYVPRRGSLCIDGGSPTSRPDDDGTVCDIGALPVADRIQPLASHLAVGPDASGNIVYSAVPLFSWALPASPEGVAYSAELEVGTDRNWSQAEMWSSGVFEPALPRLEYDGAPLVEDHFYYARLRIGDPAGWGDWTETSFLIRSRLIVGGGLGDAPYEFEDDDGLTGFTVDLTHALAGVMQRQIDIRLGSPDEMLQALDAGHIDAIIGLPYDRYLQHDVDFTPPYDVMSYAIFYRDDGSPEPTVDDLRDKRIVVKRGRELHAYLLENDLSENLILVDSTAEALRMIAADLYDFAVLPQLPGQYWRKQLNLDNLAMSKAPLYPRELCAAVREGSSHQLRRLGEALATLKRNGVYQGLSDRWFETLRPNGLSVRLMTERVFLVLLPIAAIMIGWGLWTRSLRREVAVQTRELNRQLGERRRVENALRDHEQRLRERNAFIETVLGRLPEGVAVSRISDGTVEYINSAFRSIYGLGATMFPSFDTMLTLMHPDGTGSDEFNRQLSHACASTGGEILRLHRQDITTPSGSRRVVTASFMPLAEQDLLVTVARDITDATIAERAVIESEERYRTLTANIPVGLFRISGQGKIISVNPALVRMLGYDTAEELSRVSADDFFCDRDQREQLLSRLASDHFVKDCEIRALRKDGAVVWLSHSVRAIVDETDRILFADGVVEDITERRNAQEALQTSERKYRGLFTGMINAFVLWEAVLGDNGRLADCKIIEANPAFARIVGEVNTPLEGRSLLDLYPQTEREWLDALDQVVMTGESQSFEKYHRSTGRFFATHCFRSDIQPNRYGMLLHDVTERKRAEQALVHSEERFRTVIDTARDAIFIKDANRVYISVNPSMAEIFSRTVASIIGLTDRDLFGAETSDEIEAADMLVLAGETVDRETVYPKLGYHRTFHVVKVPMRNVDGTVIGICGIARDVTEMKRLQEFSERAQRLETAGRIAGQVAHDFNNLLGPLLAYPDFIRDELPTNHVTLPIIADMERAAKQMAEINQQLLTLGRRGHYSLEQLDLNEQVAQALDRMRDRAQHVSIRTSLSPNLLHVKGGGAQLQRVVANLIANAFDAMQERGQLLITTENYYVDVPNNGRDRIPQGEYVKLTVADSGCGIPEEVLPRMYDPFFTTKPSDRKRGSGLGLSVVHTVIEDHGGIVDCQSKIGEGTSMFVYLPVSRERVPAIDDGTIAGGTATERILVVDDDQVQREVTGRLLKKLGYSYRTVASGEAALDILHSEQFDLLILDMIMPGGVDGTETYRLAKRRVPHQRAIIVSGYAESERVNEALRLGAGMFVRKPLTIKSLAGAVRRELDRRVDTPTGT